MQNDVMAMVVAIHSNELDCQHQIATTTTTTTLQHPHSHYCHLYPKDPLPSQLTIK